MTNILHITKNNDCIKYINIIIETINSNINNLTNNSFNNFKLENKIMDYPNFISEKIANDIWDVEKDFYNKFDIVIVSDIVMISMPLLYNMEKHNTKVIFYLFNRVDWGCWNISNDDYNKYIETLKVTSEKYSNRITYLYNNKYDYKICNDLGIGTGTGTNNSNILNNKYIPNISLINKRLNTYEWSKLIVFGAGTNINNYYLYLNKISYDYYSERPCNIFNNYDEININNYMGILLLPYQTSTHSLYHNLGKGTLYFIPSKRFIYELYDNKWYYWEGKIEKNDKGEEYKKYDNFKKANIDLSEFYQHPELFIYFDSWEDLCNKFNFYKDSKNYNNKVNEIYKYIINLNNYGLTFWYELLIQNI